MSEKFIARRITIRDDQARWLDEHPEISLSGLTQRAIDVFNISFNEMDNLDKDIIRAMFDRNPQFVIPEIISIEEIKGDLSVASSSTTLNEIRDRLEIMQKRGYIETKGSPIDSARLTAEGRQYWRKNKPNR